MLYFTCNFTSLILFRLFTSPQCLPSHGRRRRLASAIGRRVTASPNYGLNTVNFCRPLPGSFILISKLASCQHTLDVAFGHFMKY
jgi:hypothetical protein